MDMQNVSNLQIPEGAVRTIHDKDDKLLWGRLAYDTKYAGDTLQQTYSGKNLWNPDVYYSNNDVYTPSVGITIPNTLNPNVTSSFTDSQITVISTIKNGGGMYLSPALSPGTYHISVSVTTSGGSGGKIRANILDSSHTVLRNDDYWSIGIDATRQIDFNVTVASGEVYIAISLIATGNNGGTVTANNPQLELGSSATTYQKFVGGIPSPNPDYPQTVNVVAGTQTITLTDGVVSEDCTVDLGSTELCKIGTYQDYIYKTGDDWYVHKEIGKIILNGTNLNFFAQPSGNYGIFYSSKISDAANSNVLPIFSDHFHYSTQNEAGRGYQYGSRLYLYYGDNNTTANEFKTWLGSNNTTAYYTLDTSVDTQIIDNTLINQLDMINVWLTRYGYSATVSGNLPLIIDKTNL